MINRLKGYPIGILVAAVATGLVLAHVAIRYIDDLSSDGVIAWVSSLAGLVLLYIVWLYVGRRLWSRIKSNQRVRVAILISVAMLSTLYVVLVSRAKREGALREIAYEAYSDEYHRRYAAFLATHVGADWVEFISYEQNPDALYGYAKIVRNMRENGEIASWVKFFGSSTSREHVPLSGSDEERAMGIDHDEAQQLLAQTHENASFVQRNIQVIRKLTRAEQHMRELESQAPDHLLTGFAYEGAYMAALGNNVNPSPELEKELYGRIVLKNHLTRANHLDSVGHLAPRNP